MYRGVATNPRAFARGGLVARGPAHPYVGGQHYRQPDPPPEDDPLTTPDLIEPVVAWRTWTLRRNGDLMSANGHAGWRPGPNEAVCDNTSLGVDHDHPAPQERCQCGFYGYHDPDYVGDGALWPVGIFKAWGTIVLHPSGLRSQWAEIALLVVPDEVKDDPRVKRMREYYKVPCVSSLVEAKYRAEEHGRAVPEEMRPAEKASENLAAVSGNLARRTKQAGQAVQQLAAAMQAAQQSGAGPTGGLMMNRAAWRKYKKVLERERRAHEQPKLPEIGDTRWLFLGTVCFVATTIAGLLLGLFPYYLPLAVAVQWFLPKPLWSLWLRVKCAAHDFWGGFGYVWLRKPWPDDRHRRLLRAMEAPCSHCGWRR